MRFDGGFAAGGDGGRRRGRSLGVWGRIGRRSKRLGFNLRKLRFVCFSRRRDGAASSLEGALSRFGLHWLNSGHVIGGSV